MAVRNLRKKTECNSEVLLTVKKDKDIGKVMHHQRDRRKMKSSRYRYEEDVNSEKTYEQVNPDDPVVNGGNVK